MFRSILAVTTAAFLAACASQASDPAMTTDTAMARFWRMPRE